MTPADIHDGPEHMLQSGPNTLTQDHIAGVRPKPLAPHGRTIHSGAKASLVGSPDKHSIVSVRWRVSRVPKAVTQPPRQYFLTRAARPAAKRKDGDGGGVALSIMPAGFYFTARTRGLSQVAQWRGPRLVITSTAINRDSVCSASHGPGSAPNLCRALLQALKLQTNLRLHGVLSCGRAPAEYLRRPFCPDSASNPGLPVS